MPQDQKQFTETHNNKMIAGQHLFYRTVGAGSPLVLLHGYGISSYLWQRTLPYLAREHQLFLVDLPGYGRSRLSRPTWRLREIAPLLIHWLREMQLPPVALLGQSMGGAIALHLTATAPELVQRLVLVGSAGIPLHADLPTLVVRSARSIFQPGSGGYPLQMLLDTLTPRPRILWQCTQEMISSDFRPEIATITHPTLIIWGKRDLLLPIQLGHVLHQALPHAAFVELPRSGHRPMLTEPAAFSQLVLDFLERPEHR